MANNPDVLAGIREQFAIQLHTFERSIIKVACENSPINCTWEELDDSWKKVYLMNADIMLCKTIPIGGGVCPECKGDGELPGYLASSWRTCPRCKGEGSLPIVEKTLGQILGEVMKCGTA